ncbi:MAG: histidine--tRNA ligase [Ahrensia sp.]|nr:histidine--tRNA ligase [Ahrensia sp.]
MSDQNQPKEQKKAKPQRVKPRQPRGFVDRDAADIRATEAMMAKIKAVYEKYGFDPVETPMFEYTDALGKFLPDTDRPNAGVFSMQDDDEQWMSLRYDLTAPLARHFAQNINTLQTPYRTYRAGWVFRNEKPGPGRFRQFMQFDADTVGAPGPAADAEMAIMMADTMEALGLKGQYVVRMNNRKVLDGVMEAIGLGGDENAEKRLGVLRALDKLDKFGPLGVRELLGNGRMDESGDFTTGVELPEWQIQALESFALADLVSSQSAGAVYRAAATSGREIEDKEVFEEKAETYFAYMNSQFPDLEGVRDLSVIWKLVKASGYDDGRVQIDPSVVRGLEYYTGTVFECELTFPVTNEKGEEVVFGSVAGGGRYDGLVKRFTGQDVPATGFSIGVSRLMTALKNLGKLDDHALPGPVLVTVMDRDTESLAAYQQMVQELRGAGIRAEMYQGNPKQFGKQLQYADRRGSPIAIIQGSDERERGVVQIKDLLEGARLAEDITDNEEWRSARVAQREVPVADLVAEVRKTLDAQNG